MKIVSIYRADPIGSGRAQPPHLSPNEVAEPQEDSDIRESLCERGGRKIRRLPELEEEGGDPPLVYSDPLPARKHRVHHPTRELSLGWRG